jgi:DNA-binding CsgD family transcriptional regulator
MFEHGLAAAHRIGDGTTTYITLYSLALLAISRSDYDDAANLFEKGIAVSEQVGDRANVAYCVRGLAAVAGAREQAQRCARLFGAAERILEDAGSPVYSYYMPDRHLYERTLTAARSQLEEAAWDAAWAEGGAMVHERAVEYALEHELAPEPAPSESHPAGLSAREAEVLRLVARGMTNAKVAEKLFLSSRTVNWHLTSIYRKLEIHSRTEATRFAAEHGLL